MLETLDRPLDGLQEGQSETPAGEGPAGVVAVVRRLVQSSPLSFESCESSFESCESSFSP